MRTTKLTRIGRTLVWLGLAALPLSAWGVTVESLIEIDSTGSDNSEIRDNLVLGETGLIQASPYGDGDDSAGVSVFTGDGDETTVVTNAADIGSPVAGATQLGDGSELGGTTGGDLFHVLGIGSNPAMNDAGQVAFKAGDYGSSSSASYANGNAMVLFDGSSVVEIAHGRFDAGGDMVTDVDGSDAGTLCDFEPMPEINASGQVTFVGLLDTPGDSYTHSSTGYCEDADSSTNGYADVRKALLRYTPSTGAVETLVITSMGEEMATIDVAASSGFVSSDTTFGVAEVDMTHGGARIMNDNGHVLVDAYLDDDIAGSPASPLFGARLYVRGPGDYDLIAMTSQPATLEAQYVSQPATVNSVYQELSGAVINNNNKVLFKAETFNPTSDSDCGYGDENCPWDGVDTTSLLLWDEATGGTTVVADSTTTVPGSSATFYGFTPHFTLNNQDHAAFVSSYAFDGSEWGDSEYSYQGVFYYDGSSLTQVARNIDAWSQVSGGDFSDCMDSADLNGDAFFDEADLAVYAAERRKYRRHSRRRGTIDSVADVNEDGSINSADSDIIRSCIAASTAGFPANGFGSVAILDDNDSLYFMAQNYDFVPANECADDDGDGNALIRWTPDGGLERLLTEGDAVTLKDGSTGRVLRIFTPMPELRDHANNQGQFAFVADVATSGCDKSKEVALIVTASAD